MPAEKTPAGTVSVEQLSRLLTITPARIRQLVKAGVIPKIDRDRYPLVGAVQGYIRWLLDEERRVAQSAPALRVIDARATEIEGRIAEKRGELIPIEDHGGVLNRVVAVVRDELADLPDCLPASIRAAVRMEINASLGRIDKAAEYAKNGRMPW